MKPVLRSPRLRVAGVAAVTVALIVVLAVFALQRSGATPVAKATPETQVNPSKSAAAVGDVVTPVEAMSTDGRAVAVPADQPTVLFFMATWCGPCIGEARALAARNALALERPAEIRALLRAGVLCLCVVMGSFPKV